MLRRVHLLLLVFGLLAVSALLFTMAYNGLMGRWLQSYVLQIRRCEYLSEALCERHPGCRSYFETATDDRRRPEFRQCRPMSAKTAAAGNLCQQTGGEWLRTRFDWYCNCVKAGKTWVVDKGCQ